MKYRKLTPTGDYSFGNNHQDFVNGKEAIAQAIKTKILLFYGEWWEDLGIGIPIFQSIIGQQNSKNTSIAIQSLLNRRILEIDEVVSVDEITVEYQNRKMSVYVRCTVLDNSQIEIEVEI